MNITTHQTDSAQTLPDDTDRMRAISVRSARSQSKAECRERLVRLCERMCTRGIGAVLITNPENMLYYTGYYTKAGHASQFLLIDDTGRVTIVTRNSEIANVARSEGAGAIIDSCICYQEDVDPLNALRALLHGREATKVGTELISRWFQTSYYLTMAAAVGPDHIVDVTELLAAPRRRKSDVEIEVMRRAGRITVDAVCETIETVEPGVTDHSLAGTALNAVIRRGSEWSATWPNIGVGPISGVGHGSWSGVQVSAGDTVAVELGGVVERYHAPACRTALVGPVAPNVARTAEVIVDACAAGLGMVHGGADARTVYSAYFDVLKAGGVSHLLTYKSYGYMIGIGFPPTWANEFGLSISADSNFLLEPGMTFHMLAFLMAPNQWGIGHSESILVTTTGYETLTPGLPSAPVCR